ncbi:MAG: GNAT family N-acetyltransferase [Pseudomonadota bacterium]
MPTKTHAAGWSIRRFEGVDAPACAMIFRSCLEAFAWRGRPQVYIGPLYESLRTAVSWVAEEPRAGVVGFLTLQPRAAYVDHVFVDEDWRFCGIGRGLLAEARAYAGWPLTLTVDAENQFARGAYEAMGWEPTGETGGRGHSAWVRMRGP